MALETSTLARLADPRSIRIGDPSSAIITLAGFMSLQKEKNGSKVLKHLQHILHIKEIFRDTAEELACFLKMYFPVQRLHVLVKK